MGTSKLQSFNMLIYDMNQWDHIYIESREGSWFSFSFSWKQKCIDKKMMRYTLYSPSLKGILKKNQNLPKRSPTNSSQKKSPKPKLHRSTKPNMGFLIYSLFNLYISIRNAGKGKNFYVASEYLCSKIVSHFSQIKLYYVNFLL